MEDGVELRHLKPRKRRDRDRRLQINVRLRRQVDLQVGRFTGDAPLSIIVGVLEIDAENAEQPAGQSITVRRERSVNADLVRRWVDRAKERVAEIFNLQLQESEDGIQLTARRGGRQLERKFIATPHHAGRVDVQPLAINSETERKDVAQLEHDRRVHRQPQTRHAGIEINRHFLAEDVAGNNDVELDVLGVADQLDLRGRCERYVGEPAELVNHLHLQQVRAVSVIARPEFIVKSFLDQLDRRFAG